MYLSPCPICVNLPFTRPAPWGAHPQCLHPSTTSALHYSPSVTFLFSQVQPVHILSACLSHVYGEVSMLSPSLPSGYPLCVKMYKLGSKATCHDWRSDSYSVNPMNCRPNVNEQQGLAFQDPFLPLGLFCSPESQGSWPLWLFPVSSACLPSLPPGCKGIERKKKQSSKSSIIVQWP